ncbi:MAG TPA: hypothetical protein VF310_09145 [Vicinamibacteria bacterium]
MSGLLASLVGALALAALNTFGDFVWARFIPRHRVVFGLAHGVVLLMALGLHLGLLRRRPLRGALAGAGVGLLAAASFYALVSLLGYSAMFVSWMALWVGFAWVDAHLRGVGLGGEVMWRGLLAAVGSGLAFYAVSGIWTKPSPGGPNYAYHFICWTIAFLPGLLALLLGWRRRDTR